MARIAPADQRQAFGCPEQAVDAAVGQIPGACGLQALARGGAVQHVQHAAMGDDGHMLAIVALADLGHLLHDAVAQLLQRFAAARRGPGRIALAPVQRILRIVLFKIDEAAAFDIAKVALTQTGQQGHWRGMRRGNNACGFGGALQVAAVDVVDRAVGQRLGQQPRLLAAGIVQGDVGMALDAPRGVPVGFAMANDQQAGGGSDRRHAGIIPALLRLRSAACQRNAVGIDQQRRDALFLVKCLVAVGIGNAGDLQVGEVVQLAVQQVAGHHVL